MFIVYTRREMEIYLSVINQSHQWCWNDALQIGLNEYMAKNIIPNFIAFEWAAITLELIKSFAIASVS